jgi:hypothetical protein
VLAQRAVADSPRWTRAVEDQSASITEEGTSEGGEIICTVVRRAHLDQHGCPLPREESKQAGEDQLDEWCSFDVRSEGQSGSSLAGKVDDL